MSEVTTVGPGAILGLVIGIALMIYLVLRTKVHALLALIIAAAIAGLSAGMNPDQVVASITKGFGSTLATIGLVIGFGVMMGRILEVSGAAEKLAITLVRWLGERKESWAMAATGYIVSIPIFLDSAFVILSPLVKALSRRTKISLLTLGISLAGGAALTHHAVPPTPGPLGAAGIFGVDIGAMIFWGLILAIPSLIALVIYAQVMGPKIEAMILRDTGEPLIDPSEAFQEFKTAAAEREKALPSFAASILPIAVPILLIFLNTAISSITEGTAAETGIITQAAQFIGNPVIAVGLGVLIAIYGIGKNLTRTETLNELEKGVESAGIILLVTGAGGALGAVLRDGGTGDYIGQWVASLPLPAILIPFFIASLVRLVQGSGTVAIITGASLSAPILAQIPDVNLVFAAQAACLGAMVFSYFSDSMFWVMNRMLGVKNAKHQILTWSVPTTIAWGVSLITLLVMNGLFG